MKRIVKPLLITVFFLSQFLLSYSQLKLSADPGLASDVRKVIRDYPHHFSSMIGPVIIEHPQSTDYESTMKPDGAESATITRYSANSKLVYSWQATVLTTEDFESAAKKFKSLFSTFHNMKVALDTGGTCTLRGVYEHPVEEKNFNSVILDFENPDPITNKMKLEISLQYELMEWKVRIMLYEREREDEEKGSPIE